MNNNDSVTGPNGKTAFSTLGSVAAMGDAGLIDESDTGACDDALAELKKEKTQDH